MHYQIIDVKKESIGIVWRFWGNKPLIERIFLLCSRNQLISKIKKEFNTINITERSVPGDISKQILGLYAGSEVNFDYSLLNWSKLTKFSAKVLKQTGQIPRGKVATYSGLAVKIGSPQAARAVGTALANNPFPLIIPCHRVVRTDGSLGGFGGGIKMKKELLAREDVVSDEKDRVAGKYFSSG